MINVLQSHLDAKAARLQDLNDAREQLINRIKEVDTEITKTIGAVQVLFEIIQAQGPQEDPEESVPPHLND